jgi:hypothetical protein
LRKRCQPSPPRPTGSPGSPTRTRAGRLANELARLRRCGLILVDEVGYLPFEDDAANLFFQLVSSRYEHASLILASNLPFSGWGGVIAPGLMEALNPVEDESHGSTEEVQL